MRIGGLIAGALGGAARATGEVADTAIKQRNELNLRKEMAKVEEEMRMRLDEAAANRGIKNIPLVAEAEAGAQEAILQRRYGDGSNFPELQAAAAKADETPGQRATREATELTTTRARELQELNAKIADSSGAERQALVARRADLFGAEETRIDPMVAQQLDTLRNRETTLASQLRDARSNGTPEEVAEITEQLNATRSNIDAIFPVGSAQSGDSASAQGLDVDLPTLQAYIADYDAAYSVASEEDRKAMDEYTTEIFPGQRGRDIVAGRERRTAASAQGAAPADAAPAPQPAPAQPAPAQQDGLLAKFERPPSTAGGLISQSLGDAGAAVAGAVRSVTAPAAEYVAGTARGRPEVAARGTQAMQAAAAETVKAQLDAGKLPSLITDADRARVQMAVDSGLLPQEYTQALIRYLSEPK